MRHFFTISLYVIFTIAISFLLHAQTAEVSCFAPDGKTVAPNDSFVPCNKLGITQVGAASSCCLLDGDVGARDLCASTGLCVNGGIIRREFCTDRTWSNPACVKVCTDPSVRKVFSPFPQSSLAFPHAAVCGVARVERAQMTADG